MQPITQVLTFLTEIEKLKNVLRKSRPVGLKRYENSAEHSWHVAISALMLKDFANDEVNIERVVKMLLIHDLGEIDADDIIIYDSETSANKNKERNGMIRLLALLPDNMGEEWLMLWDEFETGDSADAKFAKAIDRVPPLIHNLHDEGHSWKKHNISKEQVFNLNKKRIGNGSQTLWLALEEQLNEAVEAGILK
ncbi:HD domain-containing protein [Veronia pacifica]|uniref:5'-deoxynucleotidase n=1 Tax=Veronia pacifica TaxID=1080227 RepID=A0A1C3EIF5_9GAMM|nr:HD domain-containing protein [Veronia pacifica]ODA33014.1 phosphohydrolase [Veronia pacifica]